MKLSDETMAKLRAYEAMWREVFDAVYSDLADPDKSYDVMALETAGRLVPRPSLFATQDEL